MIIAHNHHWTYFCERRLPQGSFPNQEAPYTKPTNSLTFLSISPGMSPTRQAGQQVLPAGLPSVRQTSERIKAFIVAGACLPNRSETSLALSVRTHRALVQIHTEHAHQLHFQIAAGKTTSPFRFASR